MTPTEQAAAEAAMQGLVLSFTKATMARPENSGAIPMINGAGRVIARIYPDANGDYHHANIFCDRLCKPDMVTIPRATLKTLAGAAQSYFDDLDSGLGDGTYDDEADHQAVSDALDACVVLLDGGAAPSMAAVPVAAGAADEVPMGTTGRLVRADDRDVEIVATLETVLGSCGVTGAARQADGSLVVEYDSNGTEVNWDSQETVTRRGHMVFLDDDGNEFTADQVILIAD